MANYRVSYTAPDGEREHIEHETKAECAAYRNVMHMVGLTDIIMEFYNPHMHEWFRFHSTKENKS